MIKELFLLVILISVTVISEENHDDFLSALIDGTQHETNVTCLCTEDDGCDANSQTCRLTHPSHVCYESWTKEANDDTIYVAAGCVYNDFFFTQLICNGNQSDRYIICCSDKDYCNDRDRYANDVREKLIPKSTTPTNETKSEKIVFVSFIKPIILIIIVSLLLLSIPFIFFIIYIRKKTKNSSSEAENTQATSTAGFLPGSKRSLSSSKSDSYPEEPSASSDESRVRLIKRSFANEVTLEQKIGFGAYGTVYRGIWHKDPIAVKIRFSNDEASWRREVYIYEEFHLNHENILRYIAADNIDCSNRIELWIGTEYHENGSVYDYLMKYTITIPIMINMMYTIVSGLFYLHKWIEATNGKPAIAHRDLKTKNILVKKDLSCCIADLGLAVREVRRTNDSSNQQQSVIDINPNHRVGTIRYMAPEILDRTFNDLNFDSYKATDLYALGLVYWEILRRCQTTSEENDADVYQLPYEDVLPNNPSIEQMHEVVCIKKIRPPASPRWETHSILRLIFVSCKELWAEDPVCRPNSCVIKDLFSDYRTQLTTN